MARIRKVEIENFRGIQRLEWNPSPGINCLIGPGDSGKSSILDAIDLCLGARRSATFTDADFHQLKVDAPIVIAVTVGELDDDLKSLHAYENYLRGFDANTGRVEEEPGVGLETVLTVKLTVASDLEPTWTLVSERAEALQQTRNLAWADRVRLAPTRIGEMASYHLGWRRASVLNRVSEERADVSAGLAEAARSARDKFGDLASGQLAETLRIVADTAKELGIPVGENIKAMLDAHSVSFSDGSISLHDEHGVPLRGLGIGSTRLLIAGLQRKAAGRSSIVLIDELEYGLEPHRIIRMLGSLGAKEKVPPLQVFTTTHSPIALCELSGGQLFLVRRSAERHEIQVVGTDNGIQGTIRSSPHAFLAPRVIVCEGASEVGFIRGLDQYRTANGHDSIAAQGVALVDAKGVDQIYDRALPLQALQYMVFVVRDDDKRPKEVDEQVFVESGGDVLVWRDERALEEELFFSLTDDAVGSLLERAVDLNGERLINDQLKSISDNAKDLEGIRDEARRGVISRESRDLLGKAAKKGESGKKKGWFKTVTMMEDVARDIVGPDLPNADAGFRNCVERIFEWASHAGQRD